MCGVRACVYVLRGAGRRTRLETEQRELCRRAVRVLCGRAAGHTDSCSENAIGAHWIWRAGGGAVSSVSSTMRAAVGIMRSCGFMVRVMDSRAARRGRRG